MGENSDKGTGSLLSYYYGRFYNSQDFKRWAKWTIDRRRPIYAGKILIGWQNDELLSRLFANVTKEQRETLATVFLYESPLFPPIVMCFNHMLDTFPFMKGLSLVFQGSL